MWGRSEVTKSPEVDTMATRTTNRLTTGDRSRALAAIVFGLLAAILCIVWQAIRLPILTLLVMFEPIVNFALSAVALIVALTTLFWKLADPKPGFPFWTLVAASLACVLLLALYNALIRLLSGSTLRIWVP